MKKLGLVALEADETVRLDDSFKPLPAIKIPYHDPDGELRPDDFFRLRYLALPRSQFGEDIKKAPRYVQPPHSGVAAYFPRYLDWLDVLHDPSVPLFITEGEFKAACACKRDFPTIGLGGVYNFQSLKSRVPFLPELEAIEWRGRTAYVVFDSDYRTNPQVMLALQRLQGVLIQRGALPRVVTLPTIEGFSKTGLDDFIVKHGKEAFASLVEDAVEGLADVLYRWNDQFAYISNPGSMVVQLDTGKKMAAQQFEHQDFRHHRVTVPVVGADGTEKFKEVKLATVWLDWPHRFELDRLTYEPGRERIQGGKYNTWTGWGCEARQGDVGPWRRLLDHLFTGADAGAREWFERWCAYPIRYPGTKLYCTAVVWGEETGTGKSAVGYSLKRVYGTNFAEIGQEELISSFNEWAEGKQLVMGDDVTGSDNREYADKLKKMITQDVIRINLKFMPAFLMPDCVNYYFTSNHSNAFYVEDKDRRYFIHHVTVGPLPDRFYREYFEWLDAGGAEALRYHLEHLDLGDFNPKARAPMTGAKKLAIEEGKSDVALWLSHFRENAEASLLPDLVTNRQMLAEYQRQTGQLSVRIAANGMGREMRKAGFKQWSQGRLVRACGIQDRYYVVKNESHWHAATLEQVQTYLEGLLMPEAKEPKY